jgi:ribonucleoside-diphosphate reductase alpha chain
MSSNKILPAENSVPVAYSVEGSQESARGIEFTRYFTREGVSPYDEIEWETRAAIIASETGEILFRQEGVEVPKGWSQTATNIVVSKYFHGQVGTPQRESSVRQLVDRVVRTMVQWGQQIGRAHV